MTEYINYDTTKPLSAMLAEAISHIYRARELVDRVRDACLGLDAAPATSALNIQAALGCSTEQDAKDLYSDLNNTKEDLTNCNLIQNLDQGVVL